MTEPEKDIEKESVVTAAEFVRGFARCRDAALTAPVFISNHGRVSHVLSSVEQYKRLSETGGGAAHSAADRNLFGLADYVQEGVIVVNPDEHIIYTNAYARAHCDLQGLPSDIAFSEALPLTSGTLFEAQMRRTARTGQPYGADLPSMFRPGRWLNFQTVPLNGHVVILFRDITEEVNSHRMADVKEAMLSAISLHADLAYVRLSENGAIERTDKTFCDWIGLAEDRLNEVKLIDLVDRKVRVSTGDVIKDLLTGDVGMNFETEFVTNTQGSIKVECSGFPLHGAYGAEGAVIVFTNLD